MAVHIYISCPRIVSFIDSDVFGSLLEIPAAVKDYVIKNIPHPSGLIGCHVNSSWSLDCCEYDIVVFAKGTNQVIKLPGYTIEAIYLGKQVRDYMVDLKGMVIIKDSKDLTLSAAMQEITDVKYSRLLAAVGRKWLVSSLFYQQRMKKSRQPALSAMWLKVAAYHYIAGTLAISGSRPMPLHELAQIRQEDLSVEVADGVHAALECIGIERATRPSIARSMEAAAEIKSNDYDRDLALSKMNHMLENGMLADCYYYIGRVVAENVSARQDAFLNRYVKLIQIGMDLSSDVQSLEKIQKSLFRATKKNLK